MRMREMILTMGRTPYMFTMLGKNEHATRKRMLAGLYSKSGIISSSVLQTIGDAVIGCDWRTRLDEWARAGATIDILAEGKSCLMDLTTAWLFGLENRSRFLRESKAAQRFFDTFNKSSGNFFWRSEFHSVTTVFGKLRLSTFQGGVHSARAWVKDWNRNMCAAALEAEIQPESSTAFPTVYGQLRQGLVTSGLKGQELEDELAAELLDHVIASHDVTGITIAYLVYELSSRPELQSRLRTELDAIDLPQCSSQTLDSAALLDGCVMETLRLYSANPGPWPRRVPSSGCRIGDFAGIPQDTIVSASSYCLHRNQVVFPQPSEWHPERWLQADDEHRRQMMRWFWASGSGARMCIGSHFAVLGKWYSSLCHCSCTSNT